MRSSGALDDHRAQLIEVEEAVGWCLGVVEQWHAAVLEVLVMGRR